MIIEKYLSKITCALRDSSSLLFNKWTQSKLSKWIYVIEKWVFRVSFSQDWNPRSWIQALQNEFCWNTFSWELRTWFPRVSRKQNRQNKFIFIGKKGGMIIDWFNLFYEIKLVKSFELNLNDRKITFSR